jgi:predicted Holliday junction resolvase-like endonuclease
MASDLAGIFGGLGHILAVCPCEECRELFYLSEARPFLQGKQPHSIVDRLRAEEHRLDAAEEKLLQLEGALREKAARAGLKTTKKLLKKIDPVFSGAGYDPQDVKVIFDPVTYVVFDGMSDGNISDIALLARPPEDVSTERLQKSIASVIKTGNFEFKTLHVDNEGTVVSR